MSSLCIIIIIIIKKFNRYAKHEKNSRHVYKNDTMSTLKDVKAYNTHRRLKINKIKNATVYALM